MNYTCFNNYSKLEIFSTPIAFHQLKLHFLSTRFAPQRIDHLEQLLRGVMEIV